MRTLPKRLVTTLVILPVAVTAVACTSKSSGSSSKTSTSAAVTVPGSTLKGTPGADMAASDVCTSDKVGGNLTVGAYTDPPGLDPAEPQGNLGNLQLPQIFGTLMRFNYTTASYEPWLAQSLSGNANSTVWTLKLNPKAKFGDGSPLDANAVKTSIGRFLLPANASAFTSQVALIKSMQVTDPTTLVFNLSVPWGSFPYLLTQDPGMIVNPAVVASNPKALASTVPAAAGAGPFTLVSFTPGSQMVLKAKTDWWNGPVCISNLTFQTIVDGKTKYDSFRSGQLQAFVTFDSPVIKQASDASQPLLIEGSPTVSTLQLNAKTLPDPRVREAIAYALDLDLVNSRIYSGIGSTSTAFLAPGSTLSAGLAGPGYDLTKAKSLLAAAKQAGYDGKLEFLVTQSPLQDNLSILETAMLQRAGFTVTRKDLQNSDLISKVYINKAYQMALWGTSADTACAWCDAEAFLSKSTSNIGFFSDPSLDSAMTALQAASTPDAVKAAAATVQSSLNVSVPAAYNGYLPYVMVYSDKLHGVMQSANQILLFDKAYLAK